MTPVAQVDLGCLSCGAHAAGPSYLFCGELCRSMAALIRYRRRVEADGRIDDPLVSMAIAVREGHVLWGVVYRRSVTTEMRRRVFEVKGTACLSCGEPATVIDHIRSHYFGDDSIGNLQPLCHLCHLAKTQGSPAPWDTQSPVAGFRLRTQEG